MVKRDPPDLCVAAAAATAATAAAAAAAAGDGLLAEELGVGGHSDRSRFRSTSMTHCSNTIAGILSKIQNPMAAPPG
jgi:Spy/CpxP family protein refolding chaperone